LDFDLLQPGVLPGRLIKMAVNTDLHSGVASLSTVNVAIATSRGGSYRFPSVDRIIRGNTDGGTGASVLQLAGFGGRCKR
jgi:hypothetical protein